ncbi:hypothetical protein RRG08_002880 [Elysia crispata]|uniref:Uncharacterized protein n=1 Tax=Elysia crispata TaxID=231223 RepID=A0AAE1ASY4_9GAST|nr:hypothetical protein RRG08_002880 [Elysia crispata]
MGQFGYLTQTITLLETGRDHYLLIQSSSMHNENQTNLETKTKTDARNSLHKLQLQALHFPPQNMFHGPGLYGYPGGSPGGHPHGPSPHHPGSALDGGRHVLPPSRRAGPQARTAARHQLRRVACQDRDVREQDGRLPGRM